MKDPDTYRFGDYHLLEHIGSGSFGTVYKARPNSGGPGDFVAIKILRPIRAERHVPSGNDAGAVEKFRQEADRQSKVHSHPNIASIDFVHSISVSELSDELISGIEWAVPSVANIDINEFSNGLKCALRNPALAGVHPVESCVMVNADEHDRASDDVHYMVSRYYESGNLTAGLERLITDPRWSNDFALGIAIEIAQGLKHIHDARPPIVHRDLKPENVLLDGATPKIADFGIAREVNTGSGIAGTEGWSSPEQMSPGYLADPRSDIYSFGQLLFWILTNEKPFNEIDGTRLDKSVHDIFDDIKPAVSDVVERCRKLEISERYQDCDELLDVLYTARAIQNGDPVPQVPTQVIPPVDNTLDLGNASTNRALSSADYRILALGFVFVSIVILLVDLTTGTGGWRWIEWAHWPLLGLGVIACAVSVITSRLRSIPSVAAVIVSIALAFGFWVQWAGPLIEHMTVSPDRVSVLTVGEVSVTVPAGTVERTGILTAGHVSVDSVPDPLPDGFEFVGAPYDIELVPEETNGLSFTLSKSVTVAFGFDEETANRMGNGTDSLVVYHHKGNYSGWEPLATDIDLEGRTASAKTRGFSVFALLVGDLISPDSDGSGAKESGSAEERSSFTPTPMATIQVYTGNIKPTLAGQPERISSPTPTATKTPAPLDATPTATPNVVSLPTVVPTPAVSQTRLDLAPDLGYPGDEISVVGMGYPPDANLDEMTIAGISVMPVSPPRVSTDGFFEAIILVPPLSAGNKALYVKGGGSSATASLFVLKEAASPAPTPLPTATAVPTPTPTPLPTATAVPTPTPTPVPTATAVPTLTPTPLPTATAVPTPTPTPTPVPTATAVPTPTPTPVPTATAVPTPTPTPLPTATVVPTPTPTLLPTATVVPTPTPTAVPPDAVAPTTSLVVSEIWGRPGDVLAVQGTGFSAGSYLTKMTLGGLSVISGAQVEVGEDGTFSTTLVVPPLSPGAKELHVEAGSVISAGQIYVLAPLPELNPEPTLVLDEIWGHQGDPVTLKGSGFTAGELLEQITIGGMSVISGSGIEVEGDGSFEIVLIVPPLSSGARYIEVHSENGVDTWSTLFYVVPD